MLIVLSFQYHNMSKYLDCFYVPLIVLPFIIIHMGISFTMFIALSFQYHNMAKYLAYLYVPHILLYIMNFSMFISCGTLIGISYLYHIIHQYSYYGYGVLCILYVYFHLLYHILSSYISLVLPPEISFHGHINHIVHQIY